MSKLTGPLLSIGASGSIGKTLVVASWRGITYARQYVIPSNPQSTAQTSTRELFAFLNNVWKLAPAGLQAPWDAFASGQPLTGRNAFIKVNLPPIRDEVDLQNMIFSNGALGGLAPASVTPTPGDDQVTIVPTAPALPTGWSIVKAHAAVLLDQDYSTPESYAVGYGTDDTDPYSINITGLADADAYVGGCWFEFLKPDGKTAYGPSTNFTFTTT